MLPCFTTNAKNPIPITLIKQSDFPTWLAKQNSFLKKWLTTTKFKGEPCNLSLVSNELGELSQVILCIADQNNFWGTGHLPVVLPEGSYAFVDMKPELAIVWGLGAYQFSRYKKPLRAPAQLVIPKESEIVNIIESIYLVRDLINIPTDDMGPSQLADEAQKLAKIFKTKSKQIIGENLLKENYASIYTVGRASDDAPRLIDFIWGNKKHPKITLVGKGVCFDSGGLDIKNSSNMLLMKKDMAGAAHVLGLARMIMQANLPVRLRVLIPAVENVISGNAYRPGDIIKSRKGLTIEIGNTDAEGRVILADALAEAASEKPDLIIDISTLTGAARVALGTDLPALFSNKDDVAFEIIRHGKKVNEPVWHMPLFTAYRESLCSYIADINNCSSDPYGGAITAALFLKEFVPDDIPWVHFDLMAWNLKPRPGRPMGGEAMALRALFSYLQEKWV